MVDALYWEKRRQLVPVGRFVGMDGRTVLDVGGDEGNAFGLVANDMGNGAAFRLASDDERLTLA